ncbi:FAD binding domain-containing protein [Citreimonas salinaria]|uniref:Carbon monoxide dehydrogenase, medium subunit n=1 Tax=Citreimonas salinaria TaxID=321339 RepID=A0A1H3LKE8_9RHOB|nr:xanthine dehydrogenase family protein subunit M [Citreimonas salinaria]SDY64448.1 carbon monoxide dehydrogenase, medium subunit [Citreimonas salinaria]
MIPSAFEYHRPADVASAVKLLAELGDDARVLAGGHSLIPMMKLRMAELEHLVDLQAVAELKAISVEDGTVSLGAMVTQHDLIDSEELFRAAPILRETALQIADPQVRYMGTIGGNVANGDPGNDMPGLMQCLGATYVLEGPEGRREVAARDFYEAAYMTDRADDEILVQVRFAATTGGYAYEKQKRKIGDYATAAAAVLIEAEGGTVTRASIAMTNVSDTPVWSEAAADALTGTTCDDAALQAAVDAMLADIDPQEDNRGPIEFKRHLAGVILQRAIARAFQRA